MAEYQYNLGSGYCGRITKHDLGSGGGFEIASRSNKGWGSQRQYIALGPFSCRIFALTQPSGLRTKHSWPGKGDTSPVLGRTIHLFPDKSALRVWLYPGGPEFARLPKFGMPQSADSNLEGLGTFPAAVRCRFRAEGVPDASRVHRHTLPRCELYRQLGRPVRPNKGMCPR